MINKKMKKMESQNIDLLYKNRGVRNTISTAYSCFFTHFATIFRRTWVMVLAFAVLLAVAASGLLPLWPSVVAGVAAIIPMGLWVARLFNTLLSYQNPDSSREESRLKQTRNGIVRTYVNGAFSLLLPFVVFAIYAGGLWLVFRLLGQSGSLLSNRMFLPTSIGFTLLVMLLLCPVLHGMTLYEVSNRGALESWTKGARKAFGRWGYTFAVVVGTLVIWFCIAVVLSLPYSILQGAAFSAVKGAMLGDPLGLPASFFWLKFFTGLVIIFIMSYVSFIPFITYYYMFGSTVQHEHERKKFEEANRRK